MGFHRWQGVKCNLPRFQNWERLFSLAYLWLSLHIPFGASQNGLFCVLSAQNLISIGRGSLAQGAPLIPECEKGKGPGGTEKWGRGRKERYGWGAGTAKRGAEEGRIVVALPFKLGGQCQTPSKRRTDGRTVRPFVRLLDGV